MAVSLQGLGLNVLNRIAGAEWPDRLGLRKPMEKLLYQGSKNGFRLATTAVKSFSGKSGQRSRLAIPGKTTDLFDLSLTEEQQMLQETLERFAREILYPAAHQADAEATTNQEIQAQAAELGLLYYGIPEAQGGMAAENSTVTQALIAECLGRGDFSLAASLLAPLSAANAITRWGTGQQQATYLPAFLDENAPLVATIAVNEPEVLFNPLELATTATRDGQDWLLNGRKSLVLRAQEAQLFLIAAQTSDGPAIFLVEGGADGMGWRESPGMGLKAAATAELVLENVRLPANSRLGEDDFSYTEFLDYGALAWCALACGTAQAVLDYVIPYCNEREAFGEPISHRQGVAFMVANIAVELDSMRMLTLRACALAEQGKPFHREAYLARLLCAEKSVQIGTDGVQLLGGHGFTKEHPVERWYRDLRATGVMWGGLHL